MRDDRRLVTRVLLRNYKSIAACDVSPAQLTFLVGPNGSGKSNFLDALRFVSDSLRHSLDHALRDRGGINEVRRRSSGHPTHFGIRVDFDIGAATGHFAFTVAAKRGGGFYASSMSDGTLRTVGLLVALFQTNGTGSEGRSLVGVEEPEVALHPAAAAIIVDALGDAAERKQVLVTSHSADLLDEEEIGGVCVLAVASDDGITRIGPLDEVGASVLRDRLYTAGELLRMDKLGPDARLSKPTIRQRDLFGGSQSRAEATRPDGMVRVVLAKTEFESWFLAAAVSIAGRRGIAESVTPPAKPEAVRDAKGVLSSWMPGNRSYRPSRDHRRRSQLSSIFTTPGSLHRSTSCGVMSRRCCRPPREQLHRGRLRSRPRPAFSVTRG